MLGAANNFNHRLSYDKRLSSCPKLEEYEKQMNKEVADVVSVFNYTLLSLILLSGLLSCP
jgi:hypothetical protein